MSSARRTHSESLAVLIACLENNVLAQSVYDRLPEDDVLLANAAELSVELSNGIPNWTTMTK